MVYIYQNQQNDTPAVCDRNMLGVYDYFMWEMVHKLTLQKWTFIPYEIPYTTTYYPGYNLFNIGVDYSIPESLTGNTTSGTTNVHLIPGEYWLRIYAQDSPTNLNPNNSSELVYQQISTLVGTNQNNPVTYSGDSDVFIVYNEYNDEN